MNTLAFVVSDVVWQALITNGFWLAALLLVTTFFRRELRDLMGSVASLKVAGASFELKDKRATIESWAILTKIFVEILNQRGSAPHLAPYISNASARHLTRFALKYAKEAPDDDKDVDLLKSIAYLIGTKGNTPEALSIYETLLKKYPGDRDILNVQGALLINTGNEKYLSNAEKIFDDLVGRYPEVAMHWYNRGQCKSRLGKFDESLSDLSDAISRGYDRERLDHTFFDDLENAKPDEFKKLLGRTITRL